jgi:Spherulation-specific family 4
MMQRRFLRISFLCTFLLVAASTTALVLPKLNSAHASSHTVNKSAQVTDQHVAVPSYIYPGSAWTQIDDGAPTAGLAIINPDSGPGASSNSDYANQVTTSEAAGITVIGYVSTSYAGSVNTARTLAAAEQDIDTYYSWYPNIDGIFLDEASTDCAAEASYYLPLYNYIKSKGGVAEVVLNPGENTSECYTSASDIIVDFEGVYSSYTSWTPPSWVANYAANR